MTHVKCIGSHEPVIPTLEQQCVVQVEALLWLLLDCNIVYQ